MKHIREYNDTYKKISDTEYLHMKIKSDVTSIRSDFGEYPDKYKSNYIEHISKLGLKVSYRSALRQAMIPLYVKDGHIYILQTDIFETDDEWFYVKSMPSNADTVYYKCDQIEGLIDCLKQIYNI